MEVGPSMAGTTDSSITGNRPPASVGRAKWSSRAIRVGVGTLGDDHADGQHHPLHGIGMGARKPSASLMSRFHPAFSLHGGRAGWKGLCGGWQERAVATSGEPRGHGGKVGWSRIHTCEVWTTRCRR